MNVDEAIRAARSYLQSPDGTAYDSVLRVVLAAYDELNQAINWDTSCLNCASLLDKNYEQYVKLDKIRRILEGEEW